MEQADILEKIQSLKSGEFVRLQWRRPLATLKAHKGEFIEKATSGVFRVGVDYDATRAVQEGRADGTLPAENQGLNGKEWVQFPRILRSLKTGNLLLRVSTVPNQTPTSTYFLNGKEVVKEAVQSLCLASAFPDRDRPLVSFDLDVDKLGEFEIVHL